MLSATFDVICDVALSGREHFDADAYGAAITRYFLTVGRASLLDFLEVPHWIPRPGEMLGLGAVRTMHRMVAQAIAARRAAGPGGADDLLDYMIAAEDADTGRRMSPQDLLHNMQFFIVAGHETTALALSWALFLLANDRDTQAAGGGRGPRGARRPGGGGGRSRSNAAGRAGARRDDAALSAGRLPRTERAPARPALRARHRPERHGFPQHLRAAPPPDALGGSGRLRSRALRPGRRRPPAIATSTCRSGRGRGSASGPTSR